VPVVRIYPEWVTSPEQGKSSGRIANFSLWTVIFGDGTSSVPDQLCRCDLVIMASFVETVYHEKVKVTVG
jgi:hypothetical protein